MKLIINKLLPITQTSEINLSKKMLVFVGKNNAGKTYISKVIWGIYNIDDLILHKGRVNIFNNKNKKMNEWKIDLKKIANEIQDVYNKNLKQFLRNVFKDRNKEIDIKVIFENKDWKDLKLNATFENPIYKLVIKKEQESFNIDVKIEKKGDIKIEGIDKENLGFINMLENNSIKRINEFVYFAVIKTLLDKNTIYLPESRLILPKFYKHLLISQKQKMRELFDFEFFLERKKKYRKDLPFESDIIEDDLIDKMVLEIENEQMNDYIFMLEQIMEGKINVKKNEEIGFSYFVYDNGKIELPMEKSSSMVNQLALLYIYFKYWYKKRRKNFLIIDEPEMNLHPEKKVKLVEFLMDFASKNKLLMTTHSHVMAKTIINYLELLELKEKNRSGYNILLKEYDLKDLNLKSEEIGIYYFSGDTIVPYKEKDETNIHFGTFTEVENKLKEIYWAIDDYRDLK